MKILNFLCWAILGLALSAFGMNFLTYKYWVIVGIVVAIVITFSLANH